MRDVKETLGIAEEKMEEAVLYLEETLAHIRAGKANVKILDGIRVDSYGSFHPLRSYLFNASCRCMYQLKG